MKTDVLIFGCTGQDGSFLYKSLLSKKRKVIGVSRSDKPNIKNLKTLKLAENINIIQGDLNNQFDIERIIDKYQPIQIYNLSAQSSVGISFKKPSSTFKSIVYSTHNLLEASRSTNYQGTIFFAGSSEIYGETKTPANINSKIDLKSPYALAKYQSYLQVKHYRELYNLKAVTGILFNHESQLRNQNFVTQKIITGAINCLRNKREKLVLGNLEIVRDWGCAEEYVEGMQFMTNTSLLKDQIICTGIPTTLREFIKIVFEQLNLEWEKYVIIDKKFFRRNDISVSVGDPSQFEKDTGWKAKVDLRSIITKMVERSLQEIN